MKNIPKIIDSTLRDGEQAPGVVFSLDEKLKIAGILELIGIEELEVGSPFISNDEIRTIKKIVKAGFNFRCSCWSRALFDDIDSASKTGAQGINISFPVSEIQLSALGKDKSWIFNTMPELVTYAQKRFKYVSIGAQDASRAELGLLDDFMVLARELNVYRVRIADTIGKLNPFSTYELIFRLISRQESNTMNIEFHGHNDLGMATANSLAAIKAGADCVSVTVNGLGERSGNAALEEVILGLKYSMGIEIGYNTGEFFELSNFVARASGREIPAMKPIVGNMSHKHESGIHTNSILKDPKTYQLFEASEIGKEGNNFVFGTHSGSNALIDFFRKKAIPISKSEAKTLLLMIKKVSSNCKRELTENEVINIFSTTYEMHNAVKKVSI